MDRIDDATFVNVFFFSSRRRHTRFDCDWSSDVCSSDLFRLHPTEELQHLLALPGVVALVVLPERLAVLDEDGLDRGGADVDPGELHDVRPSARATCMTMFAPVPATVPLWGTRCVARFMSGCASMYARTSSTVRCVRSRVSSNSRWARFRASVKIIWQRESAWTSASPLISSGA